MLFCLHMHRRAVRVLLLALLLAGSVVAGFFLQDIDRRGRLAQAAGDEIDARLIRIADALARIGAAQQSYVAPGQANEPWFARMSALVGTLYEEIGAIRPLLRAPEAAAIVQALAVDADALVAADTRARENLRLGQPLMAADVIYSDSRNTRDAMAGRLRELRAAEQLLRATTQEALTQERWMVLAATGAGWIVAVLALVGWTAAPKRETADAASDGPMAPAAPRAPATVPAPAVDLAKAAALCTALSRMTTTTALPDLLGRAAATLDAAGIIVWMGAGEELFAVAAHGYPAPLIARLGSIPRGGDNATAAAWRTAQPVIVASGPVSQGAIVAPMFGPESCIGVLAVEMRPGREQDTAAQAVAVMIAAQLATAVPLWPAASPVNVRSATA